MFTGQHYCQSCNKETVHNEVLIRKPSRYDKDPKILGRIKLLLHAFINGGHYYDMDLYVTCQTCGRRELDNKGSEFE